MMMNLSTTATLGTDESGHVERFKQDGSMYGLFAKKVAVAERWPLVEVRLYLNLLIGLYFAFKRF